MRTLAAVATGAQTPFDVTTLDIADPRPDEVLVRIEAVGVCHTDLVTKAFWPIGQPVVVGHEGAGIVERVGADITDIHPGDSVLLSFASCGTCDFCGRGQRSYCDSFALLNVSGGRADGSSPLGQDGTRVSGSFFGQSSFARYALSRRENTVVVDASTDLTLAAPMGCGFQTGVGAVVNVLKPGPGSSLVVFGVGGVGMAAVMAAAALGVTTIVAVDLSGHRRDVAVRVGATHTVDGSGDVLDQIRDITGGGATHAFDTTGVGPVIATAARSLSRLGVLVLVGLGAPEITIDVSDLVGGGKTMRGCIEGDADPQQLIPLMLDWRRQGKFPVEKIIQVFPFADINEAVAATANGTVIKPVLTFGS